ncbi:hypothetical protein USB125703_00236 [Pseudoclavibacter triregionum]|nr:hypothetical protein USB125703_00236 [Pseudoclavibacter triregionum]
MQDSDAPRLGDGEQPAEPAAPVEGAEAHPLDPQPGDGEIPAVQPPAADAAPGEDPEEKLREERLTSLFESAVYGPGDERIGKVGQVYIDDQTQEPNWVTVKTGLFGTKEYFLPLDEAVLDGRRLVVPYSKELVAGAPGTEIDQNLSPAEEDELYNYYRVPGRMTDAAAPAEGSLVAEAGAVPTIGEAAATAEPAVVSAERPAVVARPLDASGLGLDSGMDPDGGMGLDEGAPTTAMPVASGAHGTAFAPASEAAFAPPAEPGASADAAFTADIRREHGSGDDRRPGGTPDDAAAENAEADELSWMDAGERELGTPRVHDESRGPTVDGAGGPREDAGAAPAIREKFARREQDARDLYAAGDAAEPVDLDAFRRPEER